MKTAALERHSGALLCKKAMTVANHYGFLPIEDIVDFERARAEPHARFSAEQKSLDSLGGELIAPLQFCSNIKEEHPALIYYSNAMQRADAGKEYDVVTLTLAVLGVQRSIAEALILKTASSILEEIGEKNTEIHINSVGDRESSGKFIRECGVFFRRNLDAIGPQAQHIVRRDIFDALQYFERKRHELLNEMPKPVDFLGEESRRHLREVIEYIEMIDAPYQFNHSLFGHQDCYSNTLFEIRVRGGGDEEGERILAKGGRYDEFSRKFLRVRIPAVGVVFFFEPKKQELKKALTTIPRHPKVYFIHIGAEAERHSLQVIEALRKANIPFRHTLANTHLSDRLEEAVQLKVPYAIIMGQKEALQGNVIVRNVESRAQETVPIQLLPNFIKAAQS